VPGRIPIVASSIRYVLKHAAVVILRGRIRSPSCDASPRSSAANYSGAARRRHHEFTPLDPSRTQPRCDSHSDWVTNTRFSSVPSRASCRARNGHLDSRRDPTEVQFPEPAGRIVDRGETRNDCALSRRASARRSRSSAACRMTCWATGSGDDLMVMDCRSRGSDSSKRFSASSSSKRRNRCAQIAGRSGGIMRRCRRCDRIRRRDSRSDIS